MSARALVIAALVVLGAGPGCKRQAPNEDPETVFALVDALIEQGDLERADQLLVRHDLAETQQGLRFRAESAILAARYDEALELLTTRVELDAEHTWLLTDACVMGALAAFEAGNPAAAANRIAPCQRERRLDARALLIRVAEQAPADELVTALLEDIRNATPAPEVDVAAEQLELALLEHAERATEDLEALRLLDHAYDVGQDPELGVRLVQAYFDAAEARFESDPQSAATLYEYVYLARIPGVTADPELARRASRRAQDALLPIYVASLRARYTEKFAAADAEAGRWDDPSGTFDVGPLDDPDDYEAFLVWLYQVYERPRPRPTPDPLAWAGICEDRAQPCRFVFEDFARMAYYMGRIEEDFLAANPGVTFDWAGGP